MENAKGICQRSGFVYPLRELVKEWTGLLVHPSRLDHRHPQEFVRGVPERPLPYASPESADVFLDTNEVTAASL